MELRVGGGGLLISCDGDGSRSNGEIFATLDVDRQASVRRRNGI